MRRRHVQTANARLTAVSGTRRRVNRKEQTPSNERATAPRSISGSNDLGMKTNRISDRDLLQNISAQGRGLAVRHLCVGVSPEMMTVFFVGTLSERKDCADKQWLLPFAVFCLHTPYRSGASAAAGSLHYVFGKRRKKSIQQK